MNGFKLSIRFEPLSDLPAASGREDAKPATCALTSEAVNAVPNANAVKIAKRATALDF